MTVGKRVRQPTPRAHWLLLLLASGVLLTELCLNGYVSHVVRGGVEVAVRLADLVDLEQERVRLQGEIERAEGLREVAQRKLGNESFVTRAPAEVVERERAKLADLERTLERLASLRAALDR